jgi:hypothetical protein
MEDNPDITLGPLKIWISGRQFPDSNEYWDANWLSGRAICEGAGSHVQVSGAFMHLRELKKWKEDLETFRQTLKGAVELPTMEPALKVKIEGQKAATGHLDCEVSITGEHLSECHRFSFTTDQSYLPGLLSQLASVLREYPIKHEER